ncbi:MAG: TetR family transcriptional regulator [Novosphingobium sp. PASSN1]|nr:MAG: TetR family transcriptional regulator [Novosphingobium sp. PASSN1]
MMEKPVRTRLTRGESQAQTRLRLLEAARHEVARQGASASVRDIAETAGFTQGALYAHFDSKELLLLEILREHMSSEIEALETLLITSREQAGGIRAALNLWLDALNSDEDWALLAVELQMHARRDASFAHHYDQLFDGHNQALGKLVERLAIEVGATLSMPARDIAAILTALAHGMAIQRRPTKRGTPDPAGSMIKVVLNRLLELPDE